MLTVTQERELKRRVAIQFMEDILYEHLLATGVAAKSADLVAALARAQIKVDAKFIRLSLAESDRFIVEERRWNIALRGEIRRPFAGLVEFALANYGKPLAFEPLRNEMALVMRRPLDFFEELLNTALRDESKYFQTEAGEWALVDWLLNAGFADEEEIFLRNFFFEQAPTKEILDELLDTRMATDQPTVEMAVKLIRKLGRPLHHKILSFALYSLREGDLDSKSLFEELRQEERALLLSGAHWGLEEWREDWLAELKKLSKKAEKEEDLPWLEEDTDESAFAVDDKDIKNTVTFVKKRRGAVRTEEILEELFDIPTGSPRIPIAAEALATSLATDGRLLRVGAETWTIPSYVPKVEKIPRGLALPADETDEEDETDAELDDEGLEPGLANWVHDPRHEELGEADEIEVTPDTQPIEEIRFTLTYPHLKAGTLKLRQVDARFFPLEADPACLTFEDEEAESEIEVWLSRQSELLFGLDVWYEERDLQPGAIFALARGSHPDHYLLRSLEETSPLLAIEPDRLKILRSLKKEATKKNWPVFEIMCRIMADYEKGIHFLSLWAEVNVVRRTRKRTVASNLSAYHCFTQRPAGSDNWLFDERRVSLGRKKTKRQFLRARQQ